MLKFFRAWTFFVLKKTEHELFSYSEKLWYVYSDKFEYRTEKTLECRLALSALVDLCFQKNGGSELSICLDIERYSSIFKYDLLMPLMTAALLAILAPLLLNWLLQVAVKMLAILLFILCFNDFTKTTQHAGWGPRAPKLGKEVSRGFELAHV